MSQPKRLRTAPCPCQLCQGAERDHRTIDRHFTYIPPSTFQDEEMDEEEMEINEKEMDQENEDNEEEIDEINDEETTGTCTNTRGGMASRIERYILKEVHTKLRRGHSRSDLEEHLANTAELLGLSSFPKSWSQVVKLLKSLGYTAPIHYKVCVSNTHSQLLKNKASTPECSFCKKPWDDCIDYYCLGLNVQEWFLSDENCKNLMSHWSDKDSWFNRSSNYEFRTELWHGERYKELSYLWDTSSDTLLPEKCFKCSQIIPSSTISEHVVQGGINQINLKCPHCDNSCLIVPQYMKGDPRNQVILIHEDGWNPHNHWGHFSIGTITITHGCLSKVKRSDGNNALVYSFIPIHQLPHGSPHKFDAFFQPLIEEIEDLYIDGCETFFKMAIDGYSPPNDVFKLRVLPLLITADSKAHAEIGLTTAGGHKGCRRCFVSGKYIPERRHYYYGEFRKRYRYPANNRSAVENRKYGKLVDNASTATEKRRLTKEYGVTGETIFYRLYDLCGFDPVKDMVIDVMHALFLNLVKSELEHHLLADIGRSQACNPKQRSPEHGGLLEKKALAKSLSEVQWTTELKDGRVPKISDSSEKLGGWTAEEFGKFILVAPFILRGLVPDKAYESICLLNKAYHLITSKQLRIQGWSAATINTLQSILWRHAILYEEYYGLAACTENVENSLHMTEDIWRHGPLDNYWCFMYERKVKHYKQQTTNSRIMCKTFADREAQLLFTSTYLLTHPSEFIEAPPFNSNELSKQPILLATSSMDEAIKLNEFTADIPELSQVAEQGIVIGHGRYSALTTQQQQDVLYWLDKYSATPQSEPLNYCSVYGKVLKTTPSGASIIYRKGETAILKDYYHNHEWVVQIKSFMVYGPIDNKYYHFLDAVYYVAKTAGNKVELDDEWTSLPKLQQKDFRRLCVQPLQQLTRKIILHKNTIESGRYFLAIDPDLPIADDGLQVEIPHYPDRKEVVQLQNKRLYLIKDLNDNIFTGYRLKRIGGSNARYKPTAAAENILIKKINHCLPHTVNAQCIYIHGHEYEE